MGKDAGGDAWTIPEPLPGAQTGVSPSSSRRKGWHRDKVYIYNHGI